MTKLYQNMNPATDTHPRRKGLRNFTWTLDAINDWESIWHTLWHLGYKWEWQNADRYARRYGDTFNFFACHDDAVRLDMAIPLPGVEAIRSARESLLDDPADDHRLDHAVGAIDAWLAKYYTLARAE